MTSKRKVIANRRNAQRSTGPKSATGKERASRNALQHGLAVAVDDDPTVAADVARLAKLIAGDRPDPDRLAKARKIAQAETDLLRVRTVRTLLRGAKAAPAATPVDVPESEPSTETAELAPSSKPSEAIKSDVDVADLVLVLPQIARLDRYERRALSRRKRAIREFAQESQESGDSGTTRWKKESID
jgi:hypothetical protein